MTSECLFGRICYSRDVLEKNDIRFCSERKFVSEDAIFHLMAVPKMKKISMMTESYYYLLPRMELNH